MAHASHHDVTPPKKLELPKWLPLLGIALFVIGLVVFAIGLFTGNAERAWRGYLIGFWFTLSLGLSGPFIVATQYLTKAGWSVSIRRIPEAFGAYLYPAIALAAIALLGAHDLFHWTHVETIISPETGEILDPVVAEKLGFLNMTGLIIVTIASPIVWAVLYTLMRRNSLKQDEQGGYGLTQANMFVSAAFLLMFVAGFSFMTWYWIMSLDPHWYSTMYQVYTFAGLFQSGLAVLAIILITLHKRGYFGGFVGDQQIHDVGKFVFAFTVFYAYIGFCQFMLIWYANIPEATLFYLHRLEHGWFFFTLLLPFGKFIIPFLILLPQEHKINKNNILYYVSWLLVFMQLYEVWYWVMPYPSIDGDYSPKALLEIPIALGFVGLFIFVVSRALAAHNLVPVKDPYLHEAIPHDHTHYGSSQADLEVQADTVVHES